MSAIAAPKAAPKAAPIAAPIAAPAAETPSQRRIQAPSSMAARIVAGAKTQTGALYDPAYVRLSYPNGDVPRDRGACTDVVIRALRAAGYDLQKLIHQDMTAHFGAYPRNWGAKRTDRNIDHRRVPNQMTFFARHGQTLSRQTRDGKAWQPGDIVCWRLPGNLYHTGVVTDGLSPRGLPLVIHNLSVCREEDVLAAWPIIGHYRFPKKR